MDKCLINTDVIVLILLEVDDPSTIFSLALTCKKIAQLISTYKHRLIKVGMIPPLFFSTHMEQLSHKFKDEFYIEEHSGGIVCRIEDIVILDFEKDGTLYYGAYNGIPVPPGQYVIPLFLMNMNELKASQCILKYISYPKKKKLERFFDSNICFYQKIGDFTIIYSYVCGGTAGPVIYPESYGGTPSDHEKLFQPMTRQIGKHFINDFNISVTGIVVKEILEDIKMFIDEGVLNPLKQNAKMQK
jgi:hypothetical protein